MTIFDSLRYPISSPPLLSELEALPPEIWDAWCKEINWMNSSRSGIYRDTKIFWDLGANRWNIQSYFELLRRRIAEF